MRILITGSRQLQDPAPVARAIEEVMDCVIDLTELHVPVTWVHGDARGADWIADQILRGLGYDDRTIEKHPADWGRDGKRAGILRNLEMVQLGADLCLAFPASRASGTMHCVNACIDAGIPVRITPVKV